MRLAEDVGTPTPGHPTWLGAPRRVWVVLGVLALVALVADVGASSLGDWEWDVRWLARRQLQLVLLCAVAVPALTHLGLAARRAGRVEQVAVGAVALALALAVVAHLALRSEFGFPFIRWTMYSSSPVQLTWIEYVAIDAGGRESALEFRRQLPLQSGRPLLRQFDRHAHAASAGDPHSHAVLADALAVVAARQGLAPVLFEARVCGLAASTTLADGCDLLLEIPGGDSGNAAQ